MKLLFKNIKMPAKAKGQENTPNQVETRLLLALWDMGGVEVKKSELTQRVQRTKEKASDYQPIFARLEKEGAIALSTEKRVVKVSLTDTGEQKLAEALKSSTFQFYGQQVGTRTANALLKWIRQMDGGVGKSVASANLAEHKSAAIASYDEFKQVALEVYDRLNRDYNLDNLVPIYRIRRQIGDRVTRSQFNKWLLTMQTDGIFLLQGGEMPDITPDKAEDSIHTSLGELRYYATRLDT